MDSVLIRSAFLAMLRRLGLLGAGALAASPRGWYAVVRGAHTWIITHHLSWARNTN